MLLIHLYGGQAYNGETASHRDERLSCLHDRHILPWYCQWADEFADTVYVLLPESLKSDAIRVMNHVGHTPILWYTEEGIPELPDTPRRDEVWVVNGGQLPMVDWRAAGSALRRGKTDVLVFGQTGADLTHHYPESVVVSPSGEVVRFKRHYSDSPTFTDVWADEASFLMASTEHAHSVVNHIVARGWGLDSVGAMTRRLLVRWSPVGCVMWEAAASGVVGTASGESHPTTDPDSTDPNRLSTDLIVDLPYSFPGEAGRETAEPTPECAAPPRRFTADEQRRSSDLQPIDRNAGLPSPRTTPTLGTESANRTLSDPAQAELNADLCEPARRAYLFWKRAMDITLSAVALIALSPLLVVVAILVKATSPGPIFFSHRRQGAGGKEFPCLKFRSMRAGAHAEQDDLRGENEVDGPQFKIDRDPRVTKIGSWLRRTNIDELPQFFNVLVGQMSLVGPRPSPDKENQLCPSWRRARLALKPGVTGLWQVMRLRDQEQSDFQEWIYYDIEYARHRSLWLDWQIILYTPISIVAPAWVKDLAKQLKKRGICKHSAHLERTWSKHS